MPCPHTFECPLDPTGQGPEFELLLTCCRPKPSAAHYLRQQELAASGLDTGKVLELGLKHKISPLLYCNLRCHPAGTFTNELMDKLSKRHQRNTQRALQTLRATHEMLRAGQDLNLVVLKGIDVAARAYRDLAARHVGDIDILVDPNHLDKTLAILKAQGWKLDRPEIFFTANRTVLLRSRHDWTLTRKGVPHLELHWRAMFNPFEFSVKDWQKSAAHKDSNTGLPGLNNEDLLIYLCVHGAKHEWARLKWLFDLPNVLDTHDLDWPQLWQRADRLGAGPAIQQGLLLAHRYCGIDLSPEIEKGFRFAINPSEWKTIHTFQQDPGLWLEQPPGHPRLNQLLKARNMKILLWYCTTMLYPNVEDYRLLKLPSWLHPLYFPLRPVLWAIRRMQR
jgi:hypothetical protein